LSNVAPASFVITLVSVFFPLNVKTLLSELVLFQFLSSNEHFYFRFSFARIWNLNGKHKKIKSREIFFFLVVKIICNFFCFTQMSVNAVLKQELSKMWNKKCNFHQINIFCCCWVTVLRHLNEKESYTTNERSTHNYQSLVKNVVRVAALNFKIFGVLKRPTNTLILNLTIL